MSHLTNWEAELGKVLQRVEKTQRQKAGALLSVVPHRAKWDEFLESIKAEWLIWRSNLGRYPNCLVVLYGGLAFFEYDEKTFWPYFAKAVGSEPISNNHQTEINTAFAKAADKLELKIQRGDYVGSAVYHIGIPLSLWDGFLEICEWALLQDDWKNLSRAEWDDVIAKRAGGRTRLKNFLLDNREAASQFIQEMHDAREILQQERLQPSELKQVCLLRPEYFDEVPETAEFLCPQNPEFLLKDRARLIFEEQRSRIILYLPSVVQNRLPALWRIGTHTQQASVSPDELALNSMAFEPTLILKLESRQQSEGQRLRGVEPWGLFDLENGGRLVVNPDRERLPLRSYALISPQRIDVISREGFEKEENPDNEPYELEDGTTCYMTRLEPAAKYSTLSLSHENKKWKLHFRTKSEIKPWFFIAKAQDAANFERIHDMIKIEHLPLLCVAVPYGFFKDNAIELNHKFKVYMDDKLASGRWEHRPINVDDDREFYFWNWAPIPFIEKTKSGTLTSFAQLKALSPDLKGERTLSIESPDFSVKYKIYLDHSRSGIAACWGNLPGTFLPWFLLCQSPHGMTRDDLLLAKDVIAPDSKVSLFYLLHKYADQGLIKRVGRKWLITESRVVFQPLKTGECEVKFCGDPSLLWGLYRRMHHVLHNQKLPMITVVSKRGDLPYLLMRWSQYHPELRTYLTRPRHHVRVVSDLWRC